MGLGVAMGWMGAALFVGTAWADEPTVLPAGSATVYSGLGVSTFSRLAGAQRDRALRSRVALYGSVGVHERVQVSLSAPLSWGTLADDPSLLPCPNLLANESYCDAYVTVGEAVLDGRVAALRGPLRVAPGLQVGGDPWNRSLRGRYNSPGSGTGFARVYALAGPRIELADDAALVVTAGGGFLYAFAPVATSASGAIRVKAPGDAVDAQLEVKAVLPWPVSVQTGVSYQQRLTGVPLDAQWNPEWFLTSQDRWNVLQTRLVKGHGTVSIDLPKAMGLHVGATWLYDVAEGPTDLVDVSVGWHKWFAPPSD